MKRIGITLGIALGMAVCSAQTVEERVDALEDKMDRILELLEKRQTEDRAEPAQAQTPEAKTEEPGNEDNREAAAPAEKNKTKLRKGAKLRAYLVTQASYQTPQQGDPVVSINDTAAGFVIGNFLATPASKTFEEHQIGVKWEGYLWVDEPGTYLFSCKCLSRSSGPHICHFSLNGQNLIQASNRQRAPALGQIKLESAGAYFVEIWMASSYPRQNQLAFELQFGTIGSPKMEKITPGTLYSAAEN